MELEKNLKKYNNVVISVLSENNIVLHFDTDFSLLNIDTSKFEGDNNICKKLIEYFNKFAKSSSIFMVGINNKEVDISMRYLDGTEEIKQIKRTGLEMSVILNEIERWWEKNMEFWDNLNNIKTYIDGVLTFISI